MVVAHDEALGVEAEAGHQDRAGLDGGAVDGADVGDGPAEGAVAGVEVESAHVLLGAVADLASEETGGGGGVGEGFAAMLWFALVEARGFGDELQAVAADRERQGCVGRRVVPSSAISKSAGWGFVGRIILVCLLVGVSFRAPLTRSRRSAQDHPTAEAPAERAG